LWSADVPDLRALRTFVAVAEELNFTRAADRLHMAQQAVSKSVRQLEDELGVELLERTTREVHLTPAGAALLDDGRNLLAAADAAFERAAEVGRGLAGVIRVGISPAVGPTIHVELVRALQADAPSLSVSLLTVRPREIARALRDRELDLVIARTSVDAPEVDSASLRPTPLELVVPEGHRLANGDGAPVPLEAIDGERLLVHSAPGTPYTDLLLAQVRAAGATVEPVEARITGGAGLIEVADRDAVALAAVGTPTAPGLVHVELSDDVTTPLVVMWATGAQPAAVRRVRAAMSSAGGS
jgi:DNA-binding transcriptional LysR family regulator